MAALALNELIANDQRRPLHVGDAAALMTGMVDLCGWDNLSPQHRQQLAALLGGRPRRLANLTAFIDQADTIFSATNAPYTRTAENSYLRTTIATPEELLCDALKHLAPRPGRPSQPRVDGGLIRLHRRHAGSTTRNYTLPPEIYDITPATVECSTEPHADCVCLTAEQLRTAAATIAAHEPSLAYLPDAVARLLNGVHDPAATPLSELLLQAGSTDLLIAPTGVGKSALIVVIAAVCATIGTTIAIVAPDVATTRRLGHDIDKALTALRVAEPVAVALTPDRVWTVIADGLDGRFVDDPDGRWTLNRFAYTCWLAAYEDSLATDPGTEPCRGQLWVDADSPPVDCPFLHRCSRADGQLRVVEAGVVVINHHALLAGTAQFLASADDMSRQTMSMLELVLRHCQIVVIDEIDRFQAAAFGLSTSDFVLADRSCPETLLAQLEMDVRRRVPPASARLPGEDRDRAVLQNTTMLAERYLALHCPDGPFAADADGELHFDLSRDHRLAADLLLADGDHPDAALAFAADLLDRLSDDAPVTEEERADLARAYNLDQPYSTLLRPPAADPGQFEGLRQAVHELLTPRPGGHDADELLAALSDQIGRWAGDSKANDLAHDLAHRAFRNRVHRWLSELNQRLPAMERQGLASAGTVSDDLGRPRGPDIVPLGPLGGLRFGFRVSGGARPQLSAQMITGDPHRIVAALGGAVSLAMAGTTRIVVGMSATAWLPGAPRTHVAGRLRWIIPDNDYGGLRLTALPINDADGEKVRISGLTSHGRATRLETLGSALWAAHVRDELDRLTATTPSRAKVLLVTGSYADTDALAAGLARAIGVDALQRVRRLARPNGLEARGLVRAISIDGLADFGLGVPDDPDILIGPLSVLSRGHNIVNRSGESAIGGIYACVRPLPPDSDPALLLARINQYVTMTLPAPVGHTPAELVALAQSEAFRRLRYLLRHNEPFGRQPPESRLELAIEMIVDLIQLAGRARRGGTPATLFIVDDAFHDPGQLGNASLAAMTSQLIANWDRAGQWTQLQWMYDATLGELARYSRTIRCNG